MPDPAEIPIPTKPTPTRPSPSTRMMAALLNPTGVIATTALFLALETKLPPFKSD